MDELKSLLMLYEEYTNRKRYNIHSEKSVITPFTIVSKNQLQFNEECKSWMINKKPVTISSEFTHIGIQCSNCQAPNAILPVTDARLFAARKTICVLMDIGVYGANWRPPQM